MDYYQTLGVGKGATPEDIKKAYRRMAAQHHPDRGGNTEDFQKIQAAYDTLSDDRKRREYDNSNQGPQGFPGGFHFHSDGFGGFNDIFGQFFGNNNPFQQNRSQVYRTQLNITLEDAYKGSSMTLNLQTNNGVKTVKLDIPKGMRDGGQLRYDNVMDHGMLIVEFRIAPHLKFDRKGDDLYCNQRVSVLDLIAGGKFSFTTISGKTFEIDVKPGTQPNAHLRIHGEGMPINGENKHGDQIILIVPFIPDTIDSEITQSILRSKSK
jgi:DnaJ-class molecular chaperone